MLPYRTLYMGGVEGRRFHIDVSLIGQARWSPMTRRIYKPWAEIDNEMKEGQWRLSSDTYLIIPWSREEAGRGRGSCKGRKGKERYTIFPPYLAGSWFFWLFSWTIDGLID